jgi:predicted naringenin-chalcone synthase
MQVDILVVNCSVFNPTPSLAAAVINQFRLKPTVITYNLSGMGCSAGLLSIALVRELLQVRQQGPHFLLVLEALNSLKPSASSCTCTSEAMGGLCQERPTVHRGFHSHGGGNPKIGQPEGLP